jgi:hypothetical protein
MTTIDATTRPTRRNRTRLGLIASGIAVGAMLLTAPAAHTETEEQIQKNCAALGGHYITWVNKQDGQRYSQCCYQSLNPAYPGQQCDIYENGYFYVGNSAPTTTPTPLRPPSTPVRRW